MLMTGGKVSPEAEERLQAMVRTQNGFEIAELDLQLRGPGEFFGTAQAGMPNFRVANLLRDREILEGADMKRGSCLKVRTRDLQKKKSHGRCSICAATGTGGMGWWRWDEEKAISN